MVDSLPLPWRSARHRIITVAVLQVMLCLAGCVKGEPKGQVIATVGGAEVTLSELNMEARMRGVSIATDRSMRDALLAELIDRKLLVRAARNRQLDRTIDYVLLSRRNDEILLGQQLLATKVTEGGVPSDHDVELYLAAHTERWGTSGDRNDKITQARAALKQQRLVETMQRVLVHERSLIPIAYQPGFEPGKVGETRVRSNSKPAPSTGLASN